MKYYYSFFLSLALLILSLRTSLVVALALLPLTLYFAWRILRQLKKSKLNTAPVASTASFQRNLSIALYIIAFCLTLFRTYTTLVLATGLTL